jgi:hypothetical protein
MAQDFDFIVKISDGGAGRKNMPLVTVLLIAHRIGCAQQAGSLPAKQEKQWRAFIDEIRPIVHCPVVGIVAQPGAGEPCPVW